MIARIDRAENPTVNGSPVRIYNIGLRASSPPWLVNLTITKPEGS